MHSDRARASAIANRNFEQTARKSNENWCGQHCSRRESILVSNTEWIRWSLHDEGKIWALMVWCSEWMIYPLTCYSRIWRHLPIIFKAGASVCSSIVARKPDHRTSSRRLACMQIWDLASSHHLWRETEADDSMRNTFTGTGLLLIFFFFFLYIRVVAENISNVNVALP